MQTLSTRHVLQEVTCTHNIMIEEGGGTPVPMVKSPLEYLEKASAPPRFYQSAAPASIQKSLGMFFKFSGAVVKKLAK